MGEIIYWKRYDPPKKAYDPVRKQDVEISGKYVCNDERVDKFCFMGHMPATGGMEMGLKAVFTFKNGTRHECNIDIADEESRILQAEEFLSNVDYLSQFQNA